MESFSDDETYKHDQENQTGVLAQDVQRILPDAVHSAGNIVLDNGKEIRDMLIVNKDRLFLGKTT